MKIYEFPIDLPDGSIVMQRVSEPIFNRPRDLREFLRLTYLDIRWTMVRIYHIRHYAIVAQQ